MKIFKLLLVLLHFVVVICSIHRCCTDFSLEWMVIGMYAFSLGGTQLSELCTESDKLK